MTAYKTSTLKDIAALFSDKSTAEAFYGSVGGICRAVLRCEAMAAPKPGLVDRCDNGAHTDMDLGTFLRSADTLAPFFSRMYRSGYVDGRDSGTKHQLPRVFQRARLIGVAAEEAMFQETSGINTHKGAIFTLGLLSTAAGYLAGDGAGTTSDTGTDVATGAGNSVKKTGSQPTAVMILKCAAEMVKGITARELGGVRRIRVTAGEKLYKRYGITGIRGEAEAGFPSLLLKGLPAVRRGLSESMNMDQLCVNALLHLMTVVEDTNVVSRGGMEALDFLRDRSGHILSIGGVQTMEGMASVELLNKECVERNLSPGGSADLLSAALFLTALEQGYKRESQGGIGKSNPDCNTIMEEESSDE